MLMVYDKNMFTVMCQGEQKWNGPLLMYSYNSSGNARSSMIRSSIIKELMAQIPKMKKPGE